MLRIDADVKHLDTIRNFVQNRATALGMGQDVIFGLVLAVDEAATNVIVHGYRGQPGIIEIKVEQEAGYLVLHVRDWAPPFDPTTVPAPDVTLPLEQRQVGGLGVHLIRQNVDEFIHTSPANGGNELILKKRFGGAKKMINFIVTQEKGRIPVTVLRIRGNMDGSTYRDVIAKAQEIYATGVRDILLDLCEVQFMSSAGVVALHAIIRMMKEEKLPETEDGWESFRAIDREREGNGHQKHIKLLNLQPKVSNVLEMVGFNQFFEIYTDLDKAVASF